VGGERAIPFQHDGGWPLSKKRKQSSPEVVGFLGVGLDSKDGHQRLTRSEHFVLVGGSPETHERMQETAIRFDEALEKRGKTLKETTVEEIIDLFHETQD
jgi:hypothetical protein